MGKFDDLFDEDDSVFGGTPESKYWDFHDQVSEDLRKDEFDKVVEKIAAMEGMLAEIHGVNNVDSAIRSYAIQNISEMDDLKKGVYLDLSGHLLSRVND